MITRIAQRKRPRRPTSFVLGTAAVAAVVLAGVAAAALVTDSGTFDLTVPDKSESSDVIDIGNARIEYIGSSADNQSSGTGLFDPFVRLQGTPTEEGYNTAGTTEFQTKTGQWTKAIKASAIPVVDCDGLGSGTATCWELFVDINDGNNAKFISLNEVEIWFTTNQFITGYDTATDTGFADATQVYDFTGDILIHDVNQGSGRGDLRYLVELANIDAWTSDTWFVLYSEWGTTSNQVIPSDDGKGWGSEGGFEEWKVRKAANVSILKTADQESVNAGSTIGFTITVSNTGAADASDVTISDPLPAGGDWTLDTFAGCEITGSVGAQTLECSFSSLASGDTIGPIHITSPTTAADCGVVNNLAIVSVGGIAVDDDDASVTVQCGALQITKTAKHADTDPVTPTSANLVATFTVVDSGGNSHTITTNAAGVGCVGGVTIGLTQSITESGVPTGYSAPTIANVTVASGTCISGVMTGGTIVPVTNTPLTTVGWSVDSLHNGGTQTIVTCYDSAGAVIDGYPITLDEDGDGTGSLPNLPPTAVGVTTVSCDFAIDP